MLHAILVAASYAFVITLPLTIFPFLSGFMNGILFTFWQANGIDAHYKSLLVEIDQSARLDAWSVPGAPSIHKHMDSNNAFHIPPLHTNDWTSKLGLMLPEQSTNPEVHPDVGVDKAASLEHLVRDVSCHVNGPAESWVYVSSMAWPEVFEWDKAFDDILQEVYVGPAPNSTGFAFLECAETGFLCGVWGVENPALVHFRVGDYAPLEDEMDPGLTYVAERRDLRPVEVRVVELPLTNAYTGLPAHVFPSLQEQIRALIFTPFFVEQLDTYGPTAQLIERFTDYMDQLERRHKLLLYYNKVESWMVRHLTEPLGIEPYLTVLGQTTFAVSTGVTSLVRMPFMLIRDAVKGFLGYPSIEELMIPEDRPANIWEGMFAGFVDSFDSRFDTPTDGLPWTAPVTAIMTPPLPT